MKKILKNIDKPLLIISIILFIYGLIMIFSASNVTAFMKYAASPYNYFIKQLFFLVGSLILGIILLKFNSKSYYYIMTILTYLCVFALAFVLFYGTVKNRSNRWINLGFFSIQPSEFAKIILMVWLASYYDHHEKKLDRYMVSLYPLVLAIFAGLLIIIEPDLDTTIIYLLSVGSVFFLAPIGKEIRNKIYLFILGSLLILLLVVFGSGNSILTPGQQQRLTDYKDPCSSEKYYSSGNQVCNGYIAINNGGLVGKGLGKSTQKYLYLPEAHTDFIFAIIIEELGVFVGGLSIFVLYFLLIGRIVKIAKESYTTRGYLICMGVAFYIVLHISVNLGSMFGLIPTTGVPLPFMSYGGSFSMCLILALTFVQRINVENKWYYDAKRKK